jgi:hypothetical protein
MKTCKILRGCRLEAGGVHHAMRGIARLHRLNLAGRDHGQASARRSPARVRQAQADAHRLIPWGISADSTIARAPARSGCGVRVAVMSQWAWIEPQLKFWPYPVPDPPVRTWLVA